MKPKLAPPAAKKKSSPFGCLAAIAIAFLVIGGGIYAITPSAKERKARAQADAYERRSQRDLEGRNLSAVTEALQKTGCTVTSQGDVVRVTVPAEEAMRITTREARETALMVRSRLGEWAQVRVETPAGQTIATAP